MPSATTTGVGSAPLAGMRVLDLSRVLAGPWAGQVLADLGADVIKVERPGAGDDTRSWGPPFLTDSEGRETSESAYFLGVNRAKRSVTVDLKTEQGRQIIRTLASRSDVVIENFKTGTLERMGLGYESLRELNPRLVHCSVTGFGQTGPRRHQAAYDFAVQALGGLMSVTGERDGEPGAGPQKVGIPIVDLTTGLYAAIAVLAAVAHRNETGAGDHIDLSMLDVQVSLLSNQAMNYLLTGRSPSGRETATRTSSRRTCTGAGTGRSRSRSATTDSSDRCAGRSSWMARCPVSRATATVCATCRNSRNSSRPG